MEGSGTTRRIGLMMVSAKPEVAKGEGKADGEIDLIGRRHIWIWRLAIETVRLPVSSLGLYEVERLEKFHYTIDPGNNSLTSPVLL